MRRNLVLLAGLLFLAACALATPASLARGLLDDGPPSWLYLPVIANPPSPTPTPTATATLTPTATPTRTPTPTPTLTPTASRTFTPSPTTTETAPVTPSAMPTLTPTPTPSPTRDPSEIDWDPRLDQRGALIQPAQVKPGQWYWRIVKGVWYAENEKPFAGNHNIYVDTRTADDERKSGVLIAFTNPDGGTVFDRRLTQAKPDCGDPGYVYPDCLYALDFPMFAAGYSYRAIPADGNPADGVTNLGMGTIPEPWRTAHSSYLFVWRWSQAPGTPQGPALGPASPGSGGWLEPWSRR
jgi:hypothetical protein